MDAQQKLLKRNSLILWDAIKRNNVAKITEILEGGFPINHEITDSHLTALSYACTRTTDQNIF